MRLGAQNLPPSLNANGTGDILRSRIEVGTAMVRNDQNTIEHYSYWLDSVGIVNKRIEYKFTRGLYCSKKDVILLAGEELRE